MTKAVLPRTNQTGPNEWSDVEANDAALAAVINGELDNENLKTNAGITRAKLAADAKGVQGAWYSSKIIPAEESRSNTAYGALATPDEITGVVVPEGGLVVLIYRAKFKSSVSGAGAAAIFIGSNQLKEFLGAEDGAGASGTNFQMLSTTAYELTSSPESSTADATTGQGIAIGALYLYVAPGTYNISVRYKASSGSVTAKERKMFAYVLGG